MHQRRLRFIFIDSGGQSVSHGLCSLKNKQRKQKRSRINIESVHHWWRRVDLNHRHSDYEPLALPPELRRHIEAPA